MADLAILLNELASNWDVRLTSHEVGPSAHEWQLRIVSRADEFTYTGPDLVRVVCAAWSGAPSGRIA